MRYLLDTNVCVDFLTGRYPAVAGRLAELRPVDVAVSSVVAAELRYGAEKSSRRAENHRRLDVLLGELPVLELDLDAASVNGRIRAELEARGTPIGPNDLLIGAQALAADRVLVTDNVAEFSRIEGLRIENWRER